MKYEKTKKLADEDFRRLTGVKRKTFDKMVEILNKAEEAWSVQKKQKTQ